MRILICRRTEELISGIYGRYIYEQQMHPNTNIHNKLSYPTQPQYPIINNVETINENDNPLKPYLEKSINHSLTENEMENQVDSGHPSLEHSGTASNTTLELASNATSPEKHHSRNDSGNSSKSNPFVVNGVKRPPNKIILEPIDKPLRDNKLDTAVPKHLFAAKRLSA